MVNFILVIILIIVLFMVYKQMSCFDELIESIEYPTILIIYDDQYQIAKKYENDIDIHKSVIYSMHKHISEI